MYLESIYIYIYIYPCYNTYFANFILLLNTINVTITNLTKKVTCIWLAYSD